TISSRDAGYWLARIDRRHRARPMASLSTGMTIDTDGRFVAAVSRVAAGGADDTAMRPSSRQRPAGSGTPTVTGSPTRRAPASSGTLTVRTSVTGPLAPWGRAWSSLPRWT